MRTPIKKILLYVLVLIALLEGCGYQFQGQKNTFSKEYILGDGTKTIRINTIEHSLLYPWIPYTLRSYFYNEIQTRKLAIWTDADTTDYTITIKINSFQIRSAGEYKQRSTLFSANLNMELIIYEGSTNIEKWRSGPIVYDEQYEYSNSEQAIKEVLFMATMRCVDRLQQQF